MPIKINLAPLDELENPYRFVPDIAALLLTLIVSYYGVTSYLNSIREEIEITNRNVQSLNNAYAKLQPEIKRFDSLEQQIVRLNGLIRSLKKITVSKIEKYKPVIILEHLQNLRPETLWFTEMQMEDDASQLNIKGKALTHVIVSEFLTNLISTQGEQVDEQDLRSQVYFDNVNLDITQRADDKTKDILAKFPEFRLTMNYKERSPEAELEPRLSYK